MRRSLSAVLISALFLLGGCSWFRNMSSGNAKENAVQALVATTRSAVLLMTAAGIAYDAGAFGAPGSERAEETWKKIAAESVRMSEALSAWSEAIKANRDASAFQSMVSQALAVITALLPSRNVSDVRPVLMLPNEAHARLRMPDTFRAWPPQFAGGAR